MKQQEIVFKLPPKGSLEANCPDDPLPYYYRPIVGYAYCERIKQAVSLLSKKYESILEIGYGSGILLPTLCCVGKKVYGIDLESDPEKVESYMKKMGMKVYLKRGDIKNMDFSKKSFDLIVAISVMEHISHLDPVLEEIKRILKPKGQFLVGMPRVDKVMEKLFPVIVGYKNIESHHVTNYKQFLNASEKHNFKLTKFCHLPRFVPSFAAYYYNMLLAKK